ncbi:MAG: hypothetical protein DRN08_00825 [Thermoplasmata archaeon]|nr:MAG: hypothetical protein DRN08_00825 [Thermoplasmata archaeon]
MVLTNKKREKSESLEERNKVGDKNQNCFVFFDFKKSIMSLPSALFSSLYKCTLVSPPKEFC